MFRIRDYRWKVDTMFIMYLPNTVYMVSIYINDVFYHLE